jgi:hypothetical protein
MTQNQHDDPGERREIPLSAVYRQLDDHPPAAAAGYDPAAAVARLMTRWASDDPASMSETPPAAAALGTFDSRRDLVLRLAHRRFISTVAAYAVIVGISGIAAAAAALIPHLATVALAGIGAAAVLLALAIVLIHRVTMHSMTADHDRILGRDVTISGQAESLTMHPGWRSLPESGAVVASVDDDDDDDDYVPTKRPPPRRSSMPAALSAFVTLAGVALTTAALHGQTAAVIALAAAAGVLVLPSLAVIATALFGSGERSERALVILKLILGRGAKDYRPARRR